MSGCLIPGYQPLDSVSGVLRIHGSRSMRQLVDNWSAGFRHRHPSIYVDVHLRGNYSAMPALEESIADLVVMSRRIVPYDSYGIWRRGHRSPVEIVVGSGSFDVPHKAYALAVFVHQDNPIERLTLRQLDGIFGAQRTGGWRGMTWDPASARDASGNILTWGQAGATGEWADKPITPYGQPNLHPGGMTFFQTRVLGGSDATAERLKEFADPTIMMKTMSADPFGIAYAGIGHALPGVKAVALADVGEYFAPTEENVRSGRYPLARSIYIYLAPDASTGEPEDPPPPVREFVRYVLSRDGQHDIAREGEFLPLTGGRSADSTAEARIGRRCGSRRQGTRRLPYWDLPVVSRRESPSPVSRQHRGYCRSEAHRSCSRTASR